MANLVTKINRALHHDHHSHWEHRSLAETMIEELGIKENLALLLMEDMREYKMKKFFYLEIMHGLKGFFPAVVQTTKQVVVTVDIDLLKNIWEILPKRPSKISCGRGYYNERLGVLYPVTGTSEHDHKDSTPLRVISEISFGELVKNNSRPFGWALGIIDDRSNGPITRDEFVAMIQKNINHLRASLEAVPQS